VRRAGFRVCHEQGVRREARDLARQIAELDGDAHRALFVVSRSTARSAGDRPAGVRVVARHGAMRLILPLAGRGRVWSTGRGPGPDRPGLDPSCRDGYFGAYSATGRAAISWCLLSRQKKDGMKRVIARGAALACTLFLGAGAAAVAVPASADTPTITRWKLAVDLRAHPSQNPFPNYLGGPAVWSLRGSQSLAHDGRYPLLKAFSPAFGSPGIEAWHGNASICVGVPAVGVNVTDKPASICTGQVPGDAAIARPSPKRMAVVEWSSPFLGTVSINHVAVADVDPACGDGVTFYVDLGPTTVLSAHIANRDAQTLPATTVGVRAGWPVYFIVDPGPNGNAACDTTQLQVTIDRLS